MPAGAEPPEPQLLNFLRQKELLLVLDNFEHLIAAPALDLLNSILQQAPDVKLLITSRARLNLSAERLVDLAGLPFPPADDSQAADEFDAVRLFVKRSQRVRPDFTLAAGSRPFVAAHLPDDRRAAAGGRAGRRLDAQHDGG